MLISSFSSYLTASNYIDFALRTVVAAICGGFIGLEREKRYKNAGIRTHIIVAIASALMMIISKYGFFDVVGIDGLRLQTDASRIAAGVVAGMGFLGAGAIFVKKDSIIGLTTAAGLWATVGIGLAVGCGFYVLCIFSTLLILLIQNILHSFHIRSHNKFIGTVTCNISKHSMAMEDLQKHIDGLGFSVKDISFTKNDSDETKISMTIEFPSDETMENVLNKFHRDGILDKVELNPVF